MEQKNIVIRGRVTKVAKPKEYNFGPKFFMEVVNASGVYKTMVAIGSMEQPVREIPLTGDTVEFSTKKIDASGWASCTLKQSFAIINKDGQVIQNRIVCENKVQIVQNMLKELLDEHYIDENIYNGITHILLRRVVDGQENSFNEESSSHHLSMTSTTLSPPKTVETPKTVASQKNTDFSMPCSKCVDGKINGKTCTFCNGTGGISI